MNDTDLIDELREGMRAQTDHTEVPDGFADQARRTAQRRSARRAAAAGPPLLAAAAAATVLATSGGSSSSSPHTTGGPGITVGAQQAHDTAYVVKRVRERIASDSPSDLVIDSFSFAGSQETSDGSLVNLGERSGDAYYYTAPDGTTYLRGTADASSETIGTAVLGPIINSDRSVTETSIDNAKHTYDQTQTTEEYGSAAANAKAHAGISLNSSASEVQQALQNGQVTQIGTTTVNGTQAIALAVKQLRIPGTFTVYVDAQTYQPLRTVATVTGNSAPPYISDWLPATPGNVALAENDSIPAGYTKVSANNANG